MKFQLMPSGVSASGRPPHGGRGLKYKALRTLAVETGRPPHGGRGLK